MRKMNRTARIYIAVAVAVLVAAMAAVYYFFDPSEASWMPRCIWKVLTGTDCPGCGSQRMAHALVHGDLAAAWKANAFAFCMLPVVVFLIWLEFFRERHASLYRRVHSPAAIAILTASILAWWLLRNLL